MREYNAFVCFPKTKVEQDCTNNDTKDLGNGNPEATKNRTLFWRALIAVHITYFRYYSPCIALVFQMQPYADNNKEVI